MFELLSQITRYVFICLIYYFLLNFLKIMMADLQEDKKKHRETGFVLVDESGRAHILFERSTIGRADDADIVVRSPFISSKHALIAKKGSKLIIEDLNSANGTFVNGKKIKRQRTLKEKDEITLGSVKFKLLRSEAVGAGKRGYLQ